MIMRNVDLLSRAHNAHAGPYVLVFLTGRHVNLFFTEIHPIVSYLRKHVILSRNVPLRWPF